MRNEKSNNIKHPIKSKKMIKISAVIAAKNEGDGIARIIKSVKPYVDEIIVIDGHSTDNTKAIVKKEHAQFYLDDGKGRGNALMIGFQKARGDIIVIFDADGSHEASDIPALIKTIQHGADLAICSRRTGGSFDAEITIGGLIRSFGADMLTYLTNIRFQTKFTDIIYSFRAIRKEIAISLPLKMQGFSTEQETVILCLHRGHLVQEIPSREKARGWGESKLQTIVGIKLLATLLLMLYGQNFLYKPEELMYHKKSLK